MKEAAVWSTLSENYEDLDRNALVSLVRRALASASPWRNIGSISRNSAQQVMDILQEELDLPWTDGMYRAICIKCLSALGKSHNVLPGYFFCRDVRRTGSGPVLGGGFSDIWKGTRTSTGTDVCLKALRVFTWRRDDRDETLKAFYNEALLWRQLRHRHVLPFLGVYTSTLQPSFYLISPWMSNGNIMTFLTVHPEHDRFQSVVDIGRGIQYLHGLDPPVLHADLPANILVADDLRCVLADFGISMIASETQSPGSSTRRKGTIRWMPPEMLEDSLFKPQHLLARDVYAVGCTILEIYTGQPPFSQLKSDASVITRLVLHKEKPARPPADEFPSDTLWNLVIDCVSWLAKDRPSATEILQRLLHMQDQSSPSLSADSNPLTRVCTPTSLELARGEPDVDCDLESDQDYSPPSSTEDSDLSLSFRIDLSSEQSLSAPSPCSPSKEMRKETLLNPDARIFIPSGSRNEAKGLNPGAKVFTPSRGTEPEVTPNPKASVFKPRGGANRAAGLNPHAEVFSLPSSVIDQESGRNIDAGCELPVDLGKKTRLSPDAAPFTPCQYDKKRSSFSPKAEPFAPRSEIDAEKSLNPDAYVFHPRSRYHGTFEASPT